MNGANLPKISVVTPVLNGAASLRHTIESILEQEYPRLEYIVVDGGSTDGTPDIVRGFGDHVTKLIIGKDRNLYDAVAKGFDAATGDIFAWLNSDDLYMPGALLRVGRLFAQHPDWQVIYGDDAVNRSGWLIANRPQRPVGLPELLAGHVIPQASTFFRADAYRAVGGLERETLKLAGDYQLWLRLAARWPLHFIPGQLSVFGVRAKQLSGDWEAYLREMQLVRAGALPHLPRFFGVRSLPGRWRRARQAGRLCRRFLYPVENERLNWPAVKLPPHQPYSECRCPLCREYPQRVLFSSPDTRYGDRTVWHWYFCAGCELAFRFPRPTLDELEAIRALRHTPDWQDDPPVPPGVYSPFRRGGILGNGEGRARSLADVRGLMNLAESESPVEALRARPEKRIELVMPNLDSEWLERTGPCWRGWDAPFHSWVGGEKALREIARQAGFAVEMLCSFNQSETLYATELLCRRGLAGHVSGEATDIELWRRAQASASQPTRRGDWLRAILMR